MHHRILVVSLLALLLTAGAGLVASQLALAQQGKPAAQQGGLTPREAAARAQAKHGGRVLAVSRKGEVYRVKLLLDSGRVITVTIKG
ncbi:PepSY domain-containing protein [Haliea sp.]